MNSINTITTGIQGKRVYFDTNTIIYYLEQIQPFYEIVLPLFECIGVGEIQA